MADHNKQYPIKTVVVLMMENRSFDHMLGWMKDLHPEIDGVTDALGYSNPLNTTDPNSARVKFKNGSYYVVPDPGHELEDTYEQVFGEPWSEESSKKKLHPTMQGFAQNANRKRKDMVQTVMNGYKPDMLPVYKELVTQFGVCDRWFASLPASTQPNRLYLSSATSYGLTYNDNAKLIGGVPQKTIFDALDEAGHSFAIYHHLLPVSFYFRNLRTPKMLKKTKFFGSSFKNDCKEGKLPNYVLIEPLYFAAGNDDHPDHDVSMGQKIVKEVYEALRSSPQWNEILLVITYDEHGGFFDHVPTPVDGVPSPDDRLGPAPYNFKFDRLGVRVPTIFVSPWIEPCTVLHGPTGPQPTSQYEHSSIPATLKMIFSLKNFLTKRDAWAGTFEAVINRTTPRTDCPVTLPTTSSRRKRSTIEGEQNKEKLSDLQKEIVQLAACLRGDHKKETYPDKLVEGISVEEAANYCDEAFKIFKEECEKAKNNGIDPNTVISL